MALDRADRAQRAAALRAKFGALRCKHAGAADEGGQPRSQARPALTFLPRGLAKRSYYMLCLFGT